MVDDETRWTRSAAGDATADGQSAAATTDVLSQATTNAEATIIPTVGATAFANLPDPGYQVGELIGRGGMGEVVAAQDLRIGREVAVKRIRARRPTIDAVDRFLREARIQARLDHPAIVPVYELGTDSAGCPYFTMKRLAGVTLGKRLHDGGKNQPLLRAFVDVCLAIQLAHSRGVVHRDLKPSNIMLGDYGEVYVLDWGVARVLADTTRTDAVPAVLVPVDDQTTAGAILGTPGYMAPEQIRGGEAGTAADVYALGSILFEILAGEPLHPRGEAALATTLTTPQIAPTTRTTDRAIAPELDSVCFDALADDPLERPTARELATRITAYLDGDRDHERRRVLAAEQLEAAREALATDTDTARASAMRRAGRALALDPDSQEAAALVYKLTVEPPAKLPPALVESLAVEERDLNRDRSRKGMVAFLTVFAFVTLMPLLDIKNWSLQIAFWGLVTMQVAITWAGTRTGVTRLVPALVVNLAAVFVFSRIAGPFILTPVATVGILLSFTASPRLIARRWLIIVWALVAVMLPITAELLDFIPRTWSIQNGAIVSTSEFFKLRGLSDEIMLIIANAGFIGIVSWYAIGTNRRRRDAQRALHIQVWHLQQLLPDAHGPRRTQL